MGLCPFLPMASNEMVAQKGRSKKTMKDSFIIPYTFFDLLQTSVEHKMLLSITLGYAGKI